MALIPVTGLTSLSAGTAAAWAATTVAIPAGVMCYETDTKKAKVGDGTSLYSALPYLIDAVLTSSMTALLDNAGAANGVAVLDANGLLPASVIPAQFAAKPVFVLDITARDALPLASRNGIVIVADASADTTVVAGMAFYGWDEADEVWVKLGEQESFDIDFTNFVMAGDAIDRLADSASYVKMTVAERDKLAVAMVTTEQYFIESVGPAHFTE